MSDIVYLAPQTPLNNCNSIFYLTRPIGTLGKIFEFAVIIGRSMTRRSIVAGRGLSQPFRRSAFRRAERATRFCRRGRVMDHRRTGRQLFSRRAFPLKAALVGALARWRRRVVRRARRRCAFRAVHYKQIKRLQQSFRRFSTQSNKNSALRRHLILSAAPRTIRLTLPSA